MVKKDYDLSQKTFGKIIAFHRRNIKNITQEELADLVGVDPTNIGKIERGETWPSAPSFIKLIHVLGIKQEEYLDLYEIIREEETYYTSKGDNQDGGKK